MLLVLTIVHFTCTNYDEIDIFSSALNICTVGPRAFVVGLTSDVSSDTLPDTSWVATLAKTRLFTAWLVVSAVPATEESRININ